MSPQATVELEAGRDVATAQAPAPSQATKGWTKYDTGWMLSLFGTAIGAGSLFLSINAGAGGLWPLLIVTALIGPMTYLSHRGLSRLVCASPRSGGDITVAVRDYFGQGAGKLITVPTSSRFTRSSSSTASASPTPSTASWSTSSGWRPRRAGSSRACSSPS